MPGNTGTKLIRIGRVDRLKKKIEGALLILDEAIATVGADHVMKTGYEKALTDVLDYIDLAFPELAAKPGEQQAGGALNGNHSRGNLQPL